MWKRIVLVVLLLLAGTAHAQCPPAPCTTSPCTFCVSASNNDAMAFGHQTFYPPSFSGATSNDGLIFPVRNIDSGFYDWYYVLFAFDTSAIGSGNSATDAHMVWNLSTINNDGARNVTCDWHPWTPGAPSSTDYSTTVPTGTALGADPVSAFTANIDNLVPHTGSLSGLGSINTSGITYIRCTLDGGQPPGASNLNILRIKSYDTSTTTAPRLVVAFAASGPTNTPTSPPTHTPTITPNTTPTRRPTNTPVGGGTPVPNCPYVP